MRWKSGCGPVDFSINNAMVSMYSPFEKMTADEFRHIVEVTFLGCVLWHDLRAGANAAAQPGHDRASRSALAFGRSRCNPPTAKSLNVPLRGSPNSLRSELIHRQSAIAFTVDMPGLEHDAIPWTQSKWPPRAGRGTIYQPEVAADAILFAMQHRRPRSDGRLHDDRGDAWRKDRARPARRVSGTRRLGGLTAAPTGKTQPTGQLREACHGDHGAHGPFDAKAHRFSPQLWASKRRAELLAGGLALAAGSARLSAETPVSQGEPSCRSRLVNSSWNA